MEGNEANYKVFQWDLIKITNYCNRLENTEVQINYLKWILSKQDTSVLLDEDILNNSWNEYNFNMNFVRSSYYSEFRDYIKQEIKSREEKINLLSELKDLQSKGSKKIKWLGTEIEIIRLIQALIDEDLLQINKNRFKEFIVKHFYNKKGEPFNNKQLYEVETKYLGVENPKINSIIDRTKQQN
ncbi:MAG: hypothetical protein ACW963_05640 [Candidatus Sifarchaeia archaeon]